MKIEKLLMDIRNKEFKLESGLEVKKYLPIEAKKTIAQAIIYDCTSEEDGVVKVDSVERYMSYVRYMITTHTNLEYTDEYYDTLCSTEYGETTLLNAIMSCFEADAKECSRILELMMNDYMQEFSIDFTVLKFLNDTANALNKVVVKVSQVIEDVDLRSMIPDSVDMDKLGVFLNKYIK